MASYDGQVVINTKLDDQGLKKGITGLQNTSVNALKKVKQTLIALGIGVGVAAAVKGINNMIKSTAQLTDQIDKQSQKIGMSRKAYQEWSFIFSQSGASVDGLQMGLKTLSTAMDEANKGTKTYTELFDRLNVTIHDTNGNLKDQESIFNEVFKALSAMENETERTAIASRLLGRSATELAPAMNGGAEAIEEMREKAYELGLVLEDTTIDIGVKLTDALDQMKRAMQSATARAIEPLMGTITDMAASFTETAIPAIEKFLSTAFKVGASIPPIFHFMKAVVTAVMKEISEALDEPWNKLKGFINDLVNLPIVQHTIDIVLNLAGDLWKGLKKGVSTGDWSDFWKAAVGVAQFAIGIGATLTTISMSATALFSAIQGALVGVAGFSKAAKGSTFAAMISVGLAVIDAMQTGDWDALAENVIAALTGALIAGGLTKSPTAGFLTFTILLNFKVGETIMDALMPKPYQGSDVEKQQIQDIIGAAEGFITEYGAIGAARKKLIKIWGIDTGREILAGLGVGLADIDKISEDAARTLLYAVQDELGIESPSKAFQRIGEYAVEGLETGLAGMGKAGAEGAQAFLDAVQDTLGVHSESKEGKKLGNAFIDGLIAGLIEMFPELESEAEKMRDALARIWGEQPVTPGVAPGEAAAPASIKPTFGQQLHGISDQVVEGWKQAREEMTKDILDWATWSKSQFMSIGNNLGSALGAGVRSLGQSIATQKDTIAELGSSIADIQDNLTDAYDDLEDAQDDYAKAVLSGDKTAIKNAEKRVKQQEKLIKGYDEQLTALKEEKKSVEDGSKTWGDFAKTILGALADTLYGLGAELAARAAVAAVTFRWASAAAATAGSVAAFAAAVALDAWAGSYAEGGIVPQMPGVSPTGDQHVALVNPGELILNAAQQSAIAAQLAMFARLTDVLSSMQLSAHGGITIDLSGSTFNDMGEEAVGKAIYRNVKSLQAEGVLPRW